MAVNLYDYANQLEQALRKRRIQSNQRSIR